MSTIVLWKPVKPAPAPAPARERGFAELGAELGITRVQADRWKAFAAALEELRVGRRELDARAGACAMDAPPDVEAVIEMQATWAQSRLAALQRLTEHTRALCEVLTARQRQKANRLLQSLSLVA